MQILDFIYSHLAETLLLLLVIRIAIDAIVSNIKKKK